MKVLNRLQEFETKIIEKRWRDLILTIESRWTKFTQKILGGPKLHIRCSRGTTNTIMS